MFINEMFAEMSEKCDPSKSIGEWTDCMIAETHVRLRKKEISDAQFAQLIDKILCC